MPSFPIPGSDIGTWGSKLNVLLAVALNSDGTLKTPINLGSGDNFDFLVTTMNAKLFSTAYGTSGAPITSGDGGVVKLTKTEEITETTMPSGVGANNQGNAVLVVGSKGTANTQAQVNAIFASADTASTQNTHNDDAAALSAIGRVSGSGTGIGMGAYLEGRRDTATGSANALQLGVRNYTSTNGTYNSSGFSDTTGIWLFNNQTNGATQNGVAIAISNPFSIPFDVGIGFTSQNSGAVVNSSIRDDGNSAISLDIRGTHNTSAMKVSSTTTDPTIAVVDLAPTLKLSAGGKIGFRNSPSIVPTASISSTIYGSASIPAIAPNGGVSNNVAAAVAAVFGRVDLGASYTGTVNETRSLYAANPNKNGGSGVITTAYGVYIEDITTAGTNNYGLYAAGTTNRNFVGSSLEIGANSATSGNLRLPNNAWIAGRNAANNANLNIVRVNTTDQIEFGGQAVTMPNGILSVGSTPSATGQIRIENNAWIAGRNTANNADLNIFKVNTSDQIEIGSNIVLPSGKKIGIGTTSITALLSQHQYDQTSFNSNRTPMSIFFLQAKQAGTVSDGNVVIRSKIQDRSDVTQKTITNATNNGSGAIRITAIAHGYSTGDKIIVDAVGGTTEANGLWTITSIDADNFDLQGSTFTHTYTSGGIATNRGLLYAISAQVAPQVNRGGITSVANGDDVVAIVVSNVGTAKATEGIYLGHNSGISGDEYGSAIAIDAFATYGLKLTGTFSSYGIEFQGGTFTNGAMRLPNNTWINARNAANNADINVFRVDTSNRIATGTALLLKGPIHDLKAWGAVGDGTTDDTAAINSAFSAVSSGGVVWVPTGTFKYVASAQLDIPSDVIVDGPGTILISASGSNGYIRVPTGNSNVTIRNITLKRGNTTASRLLESHANNVTVRNVRFQGNTFAGSALTSGSGADGLLVTECFFDTINGAGFSANAVTGIRVLANRFKGHIGGSAIYLNTSNTKFEISDNEILMDATATDTAIGVYTAATSTYATHGRIANNYIETVNFGIEVINTSTGDAPAFVSISGNNTKALAGSYTGISIAGRHITVSGNTIDVNGITGLYSGIEVVSTTAASITGNTISGDGSLQNGIILDKSSRCSVTGNTINGFRDASNCQAIAVVAPTGTSSASDNTITGNNIFFPSTSSSSLEMGIILQCGATGVHVDRNVIVGNHIYGNNVTNSRGISFDNPAPGSMDRNLVASNVIQNCATPIFQSGDTNTLLSGTTWNLTT